MRGIIIPLSMEFEAQIFYVCLRDYFELDKNTSGLMRPLSFDIDNLVSLLSIFYNSF